MRQALPSVHQLGKEVSHCSAPPSRRRLCALLSATVRIRSRCEASRQGRAGAACAALWQGCTAWRRAPPLWLPSSAFSPACIDLANFSFAVAFHHSYTVITRQDPCDLRTPRLIRPRGSISAHIKFYIRGSLLTAMSTAACVFLFRILLSLPIIFLRCAALPSLSPIYVQPCLLASDLRRRNNTYTTPHVLVH